MSAQEELDFQDHKLYSFEAIYDNEESQKVFKTYMKDSFVSEMYEFLEQVDDYLLLRSNMNRKHKAKKIVETFLLPNSPGEINIPEKTRKEVLDTYEESKSNLSAFPPLLFIPAQRVVHHDLTFDVFPRFVQTDDFQKFIKSELKKIGEKNFKMRYVLSESQAKENEEIFDAYKQFKEGKESVLLKEKTSFTKEHTLKIPLRFDFDEKEIESLANEFCCEITKEYVNELVVEMFKPLVGCPLHRVKGLFTKSSSKREILGSDAVKWIQNYMFLKTDTPIPSLMNFLIQKKILIPKDPKKTTFDLKSTYSFGFKKKVVVCSIVINIKDYWYWIQWNLCSQRFER
jgi:hypothetical protein